MNIIFAGTPEFAATSLRGLLASEHTVTAVLTQPDRPAGRGRKAQFSAVKALAQEANITVLQPVKLNQEAFTQIKAFDCDIMVVAAYGLIIPQFLLDWPRLGCINVHASLLPRWRGAAPIQRAIEAGDDQTGITIMQMDAGLDTGMMLSKAGISITAEHDAKVLHDELSQLGAELLITTLTDLETGVINAEPQNNEDACYAKKLNKEEGEIIWANSAREISRQIRAFTPWPGCFSFLQGERIKILQASINNENLNTTLEPGQIINAESDGLLVATGNGTLCIKKLQLAGKKAMDAKAVINGYPHWTREQLLFTRMP